MNATTNEKPSASTEGQESTRQRKLRNNSTKPPCKIHRILAAFARGEKLNLFEAQRLYSDRSLHSTVSEIQSDYGLEVSRDWETVPGFQGLPTRCRRYWLEESQLDQARALLP